MPVTSYGFENLKAWQESKSFVVWVYELLKDFPKNEEFGLNSQLKRAAISIPTNIAEGSGRRTPNDQMRFYRIAYSSALECANLLYIAHEVGFVSEDKMNEGLEVLNNSTRLINGLVNALKRKS